MNLLSQNQFQHRSACIDGERCCFVMPSLPIPDTFFSIKSEIAPIVPKAKARRPPFGYKQDPSVDCRPNIFFLSSASCRSLKLNTSIPQARKWAYVVYFFSFLVMGGLFVKYGFIDTNQTFITVGPLIGTNGDEARLIPLPLWPFPPPLPH